MLASAREHYLAQQRLTVAAVARARQVASRGSVDVARVIAGFQLLAAQQAARAVPAMLAEQGVTAPASGSVAPTALAGVASNGLPLVPLLDAVQTTYALERFVATQVQDMGRAAASVSIASRPEVEGWVRMLNPPSCERCVVQAGKWFRWNQGFERHPKCDCVHIPASEAVAGDLTVNPDAYFHSLSEDEQDKTFGKKAAQAIRDGADIGQVVNARRGMSTAQVNPRGWIPKGRMSPVDLHGRKVFTTTEGTTKRGLAYKALTRANGKRSPRLMPESLYAIATDRADAIRLLRAHGYLL